MFLITYPLAVALSPADLSHTMKWKPSFAIFQKTAAYTEGPGTLRMEEGEEQGESPRVLITYNIQPEI